MSAKTTEAIATKLFHVHGSTAEMNQATSASAVRAENAMSATAPARARRWFWAGSVTDTVYCNR